MPRKTLTMIPKRLLAEKRRAAIQGTTTGAELRYVVLAQIQAAQLELNRLRDMVLASKCL